MIWGFYSCMRGPPWGGSEELWSRAALRLLAAGDKVTVNYGDRPEVPEPLRRLQQNGGRVHWRSKWSEKVERRLARRVPKLPSRWLDRRAPDFVLITQGMHTDYLGIAQACQHRGIPYAINVQCASESYWIASARMDSYDRAYREACAVFFLSPDNQRIVETNICRRIENAHIVDNPCELPGHTQPSWPDSRSGWKLACVARLNFESKGQDMILDVLRMPKWRERPLHVTFYGQDHGSLKQMQAMIVNYGLEQQVTIGGFSDDVHQIWSEHHALLLPSRYEGLPMVTVEAMLGGRIGIVTTCGRNAQLMDDGGTGFHIAAPTARFLDVALERAWSCRDRWRQMGELAARRIRERYSNDPTGDFVHLLRASVRSASAHRAA